MVTEERDGGAKFKWVEAARVVAVEDLEDLRTHSLKAARARSGGNAVQGAVQGVVQEAASPTLA